MKKIYVAGKYSGSNVVDILRNIGRGRQVCAKLFELGYAPYCLWHDATFVTDNPEGAYTVDQFKAASMEWLKVSDAVLVISMSGGVQAEIDHINHMVKFLAPSGRLVSVASSGVTFRENKKTVEFREMVAEHGYIEPLPQGAFKASGTGVNTVVVVMDRG